MELREKVKEAGGYWDAKKKAWYVSYVWVMRIKTDKYPKNNPIQIIYREPIAQQ